jgi:hypothetical protein
MLQFPDHALVRKIVKMRTSILSHDTNVNIRDLNVYNSGTFPNRHNGRQAG